MHPFSADTFASRSRLGRALRVKAVLLLSVLTIPAAPAQQPVAKPAAPKSAVTGKPLATPPAAPEPPLYEHDPFDLIVLDEENQNARLKVLPLPLPKRRVPSWNASTKFTIRLVDDPDEEYEVNGRNIKGIDLFETMLINEGRRLIGAAQAQPIPERSRMLDEAFHHFYRVQQIDPDYPGLKDSINQLLFYDAGFLNSTERYAEALAVLEELHARDPNYKLLPTSRPLSDLISGLFDRILKRYFDTQNYIGMRSLIKNAAQKYGAARLPSLAVWSAELNKLASQKRDLGRQLLDVQRFREAIDSVKAMQEIWPDVEGARALEAAVSEAYPIIFVGVTQPALDDDAERLDNWGARRTGRLVHRTLVEFLGAGPEGGQYQLSHGSIEHSEDRRQLLLRLDRPSSRAAAVTGFDISSRLIELASPGSPDFVPAWGSLVTGIKVKNVYDVEVNLRYPHVVPEAYLRVPFVGGRRLSRSAKTDHIAAGGPPLADGDGPFRVQSRSPREVQFASKAFQPGAPLAEIVEVTFDESQRGLAALRRGEIDVLDRLFPADALSVRAESSPSSPIRVEPYSLATVHLVVPNLKHPFLADRDFRRAMLLAIDRETILRQELMGGRRHPGFQVISGPFPASAGEADPLGYAYDETTRPLPYSPFLAKVLTVAATRNLVDAASKRGEPAPKLTTLTMGFPGHELARVSCQAISAQLQTIGVKVELKEFPAGVSDDISGECDLVYKEIALWEPVTDARRILGETGVAPAKSPYVQQSLRWLDEAMNWSEARERLVDIHRAVYHDVAVLPLWQTVDFFAYDKRVTNIGVHPVWLYQNVDQWRISVQEGAR